MTREHTNPDLIEPHQFVESSKLDDRVNHAIIESELLGGVYVRDIPPTATLEIETENHSYTALILRNGEALISGHPELCPEPVLVRIDGSTWGGSMMKPAFIGRGMCLEFWHPPHSRPIVTSRIVEIRQVVPHPTSAGNPLLSKLAERRSGAG